MNENTLTIDDTYCMFCIRCGSNKDITMLPNRNKNLQMVGFHFVCLECMPYLAGADTRTEFGQENTTDRGTIQ